MRGRHQITRSFSVTVSAAILKNQNPSPGINYEFLLHRETASVLCTPSGRRHWDFQGTYSRSALRSNLSYLDPSFFSPLNSSYWNNSHVVTALLNLILPGVTAQKPLTLGGSALVSSGSNPTNFYEPVVRPFVPLRRNLAWTSDWQYYGFEEAFYSLQSFRTHQITTGLRFTR